MSKIQVPSSIYMSKLLKSKKKNIMIPKTIQPIGIQINLNKTQRDKVFLSFSLMSLSLSVQIKHSAMINLMILKTIRIFLEKQNKLKWSTQNKLLIFTIQTTMRSLLNGKSVNDSIFNMSFQLFIWLNIKNINSHFEQFEAYSSSYSIVKVQVQLSEELRQSTTL